MASNDKVDHATAVVTSEDSHETAEAKNKAAVVVDPESIVPQLEHQQITHAELQTAIRVLSAVSELPSKKRSALGDANHAKQPMQQHDKGLEAYKHKNLRPFRKALAACLELHQRTMYGGKQEEDFFVQRKLERSLKRQKLAETEMQKKHIATTALRKGRIERLQALQQEEGKDEERIKTILRIPDGHVETTPLLLENGQQQEEDEQVKLPKLRSCYVCKVRYRDLHHFYDQLCPACASLNWQKRHQTSHLQSYTAVVTGARVKIGFQVCLKLLRAGCRVVATTRFPVAAAAAYRREADFLAWKDQLSIFGLDLRDVAGLEGFTRFLKMKCHDTGLDIIINNACQTIRRPAGYYRPAVEQEQSLWEQADEDTKSVLSDCRAFEGVRRRILQFHQRDTEQTPSLLTSSLNPDTTTTSNVEDGNKGTKEQSSALVEATTTQEEEVRVPFDHTGISHSAAMSQMIILPEDAGVSDSILPPGVTDVNGQQLDLRTTNSWLLKMDEVSTPEVMECMFVNAIAPFVLNSRLKPLMTIPENRPDRYIINVSAMEGKFYRYKTPNHPHTNMAKAALNMMTRTSAEDLAKSHRIYMNSVDTGWINDENPLERANRTAEKNQFQTPIDEIDAAARILDLVFTGVEQGETQKPFGKFLKDYRESEW